MTSSDTSPKVEMITNGGANNYLAVEAVAGECDSRGTLIYRWTEEERDCFYMPDPRSLDERPHRQHCWNTAEDNRWRSHSFLLSDLRSPSPEANVAGVRVMTTAVSLQ